MITCLRVDENEPYSLPRHANFQQAEPELLWTSASREALLWVLSRLKEGRAHVKAALHKAATWPQKPVLTELVENLFLS